MMVDCKQFAEMVLSAGAQIRANQELLSKLDSQGGDGDHGTTMARAMDSIEKALEENSSTSLKELLEGIGWAVMGVDGGATGPLFGTFFMSMAGAAAGKDALDAKGFGEVLAAGLAGVQKRMLRSAYEAAKTGAENTATLRARFGRAKNIGDKSIGHPDAGATSVSLIFRGFLEGVSSDA